MLASAELRALKAAITLAVFALVSFLYQRESFPWNQAVGFTFIALAAAFESKPW